MGSIEEKYIEYTVTEKKIDELYHKIAIKMGVSDSVMWTLYCLCEKDKTHTQNTVAERMGVPKQTINSAISRLLKDGLICLEKLSIAGNNKQILLTEQGKAFCEKHIMPLVAAEERAFGKLHESEQEQYLSLGIRHNEYLLEEFHSLLETE